MRDKQRQKEYNKLYYAQHIEKARAVAREYRLEHLKQANINLSNYRATHRDEISKTRKAYNDTHQMERKEYKRSWDDVIGINRRLKRYYNITLEEYDQMVGIQGGKCAICGGKNPNGKRLHVDHNHKTGKIRGLLCFECNTALGNMKDDIDILNKAITYLRERSGDG